jgi:hypothetical protein
LLEDEHFDLLRLWRAWQGGMGPGHLPERGGMLDQPAWLMDAFALMSKAERDMKPPDER